MIAALLALWLGAVAPAPAGAGAAPAPRQARLSARGQVRSAGERQPIAGARVFARSRRGPDWTREATSAADGSFALHDLPGLEFTLVIVAADHERLEQPTTAAYWKRRRPPTIYLQPSGAGRYRTVVAQERTLKPSPFSVRLAPDELAALPGSQGDPLRALQNLPGAARVPGGLGLIVLRGAAPDQSQVFVGEHPVPRAFHIPGLASVVPAGVLSGLQYIPSNFAPNYGDATGGVVVLTPRVGRRDGTHGHLKLDIISAGAQVEGRFGRGSFLVAAQRGYLDLVMRALGPEIVGPAHLRPKYSDYQIILDHPVGQGGTLTLRIFGASDELRYVSSYALQSVAMKSSFHRFDLVYRKRLGAWEFLLAPALRLDRSSRAFGPFLEGRQDVIGLLRAELTVRPGPRVQLTLGADTNLDRARSRFTAVKGPGWQNDGSVETGRGFLTSSGLYVTPLLTFGKFSLSPGLRVSAFTAGRMRRAALDPRLLVRWAPHERVAVQLGAGRYAQPFFVEQEDGRDPLVDSPLESLGIDDHVVLPGAIQYLNPQLAYDADSLLGLARATQLSANLHLRLAAALGLDLTGFYRRVRLSAPFGAAPDRGSDTYGLEVMLRHDLTRRLFGWVAYTLLSSQWGEFLPDRGLVLRGPADFDQRHNFVALLGVKLPRRWQLAGRFRLVTGLPYTPLVGGNQFEEGVDPFPGAPNSARMPVFHQLDVRLDKTWVLRRSVVAAYLDVQNVYNRQNPEGLWYRHDYSGTRTVVGLPILPVLGVRVEY